MIGGAMMTVDVSVPLATPVPETGEELAVSANAVPTRNESHFFSAPNADVLVDPADGDEDGAGGVGFAGAGEEDDGVEEGTGAGAGAGVGTGADAGSDEGEDEET